MVLKNKEFLLTDYNSDKMLYDNKNVCIRQKQLFIFATVEKIFFVADQQVFCSHCIDEVNIYLLLLWQRRKVYLLLLWQRR